MPDHVPLTTATLTVQGIHPHALVLKSWRVGDSMAAFCPEFPIYWTLSVSLFLALLLVTTFISCLLLLFGSLFYLDDYFWLVVCIVIFGVLFSWEKTDGIIGFPWTTGHACLCLSLPACRSLGKAAAYKAWSKVFTALVMWRCTVVSVWVVAWLLSVFLTEHRPLEDDAHLSGPWLCL